jgi:hypothetical protein
MLLCKIETELCSKYKLVTRVTGVVQILHLFLPVELRMPPVIENKMRPLNTQRQQHKRTRLK